jgi:DNA adenine methylase
MNKILRSPLFYVGDKFKLVSQIKNYFPENIDKFVEPFVGGGSVFLNVEAKKYYLNDIDKWVFELHSFLQKEAKKPNQFFEKIETEIANYQLSYSYKTDIIPQKLKDKHKKTYFAKFNQDAFSKLKQDFNANKSEIIKFYLLLIYGFNRMIRFNSKGDYNIPVGNVDFNKNVVEALKSYFEVVPQKKITFKNLDYVDFLPEINLNANDFVYLDPPYLITFSEYNKLWNETREIELLQVLDNLHAKNIRFAISNVTHYKGKENTIFIEWAEKYNIFPIKSNYISYHDNSIKKFQEVLVTNYEKKS